MSKATYGLEIVVAGRPTTYRWMQRGDLAGHIKDLGDAARKRADDKEVRVRYVVAPDDGHVYVREAGLALHCHWRPTVLRCSHTTYPSYRQQHAVVNLVDGRVLVVDQREDDVFTPKQYAEWSRNLCLEERVPGQKNAYWGDHFWPEVRKPADDEAGCHYVVRDATDLQRLADSKPVDLIGRPFPAHA